MTKKLSKPSSKGSTKGAKPPALKVVPCKIPAPIAKKTGAQLTPAEALELRLLEFQVTTAKAAYDAISGIRNARATQIVTSHGVDMSEGKWHLDADAGTIKRVEE